MAREHGPVAGTPEPPDEDLETILEGAVAAHPRIDECISLYGREEMLQVLSRTLDVWLLGDPVDDVLGEDASKLKQDAVLLLMHYVADPIE